MVRTRASNIPAKQRSRGDSDASTQPGVPLRNIAEDSSVPSYVKDIIDLLAETREEIKDLKRINKELAQQKFVPRRKVQLGQRNLPQYLNDMMRRRVEIWNKAMQQNTTDDWNKYKAVNPGDITKIYRYVSSRKGANSIPCLVSGEGKCREERQLGTTSCGASMLSHNGTCTVVSKGGNF
ncbi:unnamed protein product [Nippostrongylus brasiliensis]|uniref:Astacin domain-containing protein n=1 Tax=Nippostrongylus brasiliensis TaxID=27835 RepID=A0A0N4XHF1_NIPBR|nr:unnamed protein product [Nippostrongylus brasiliensis]